MPATNRAMRVPSPRQILVPLPGELKDSLVLDDRWIDVQMADI
jgi:hypothetical protein